MEIDFYPDILNRPLPCDTVLHRDHRDNIHFTNVYCALNMGTSRFFINRHMEQDPEGRGGLCSKDNAGILLMDTLIGT